MSGDDVIVLCEGKRDVRLLEAYYETHDPDVQTDRFIGEEVPHSEQKNTEARKIRNFVEPRNPYDALLKSEEGDTLVPLFVKLVGRLVRVDPRICLVIDLDTEAMESYRANYEALVDDLDRRVGDNYSGSEYGIETVDRLARSQELLATRCRLTDRDGTRGTFSVLAFRTNLEDAAETGDYHSDETQKQQLREFVTSDAADPMHAVL